MINAVNINGVGTVECLRCGRDVWWLVTADRDGVCVSVDPCSNCSVEKDEYHRVGQEPKKPGA